MTARGWLGLLIGVLLLLGGGVAFLRLEGEVPRIDAPERVLVGKPGARLELAVSDPRSGLRSLTAVLVHAQGEQTLAAQAFTAGVFGGQAGRSAPERVEVVVDASGLPREIENAVLRVTARDGSWRGFLSGNEASLEIPVTIDRKPPRIGVETGLSYARRGGSGVVVYVLSEETARDGVRVGEAFYPGHALDGRRVAFFAIATDAPANPEPRVVATDAAGNEASAAWPLVVKEHQLPEASITLPPSFFERKVVELSDAHSIEREDLEKAFDRINTELRRANEEKIRSVVAESVSERLWEGAFAQLANSQVTSRFAEQRSYFVAGRKISQATHYGYDLASTAGAPVTSAAAGRVLYAEDLGIYGNCVLIDHGLGISSLYGHLSRVDVEAGDRVTQGQTLGLSGATGLAGGDHLHFAVLVSGTYVDPLEWWDPKWMRESVDARLAPPAP